MKNYLNLLLLSFIACLFATQQAKAQYYGDYDYITYSKHEVFVQYGAPSFQELSTQIRHTSLVARDGNTYEPSRFGYTGVFALGYNYYRSPYVSFGGYLGLSAAMLEMSKKGTSNPVFRSTVLSITGLITGNWVYFRSGLWEMSAQAAVGMTRWIDDQEMMQEMSKDVSADTARWRFAYHLSPFHVRWGGTLGVFADLGWGYKGVVNAGMSVKF